MGSLRAARATGRRAVGVALGAFALLSGDVLPAQATAEPAPVASGTITGSDGAPAANADVVLIAWPSDKELATLRPGDPVKVLKFGQARADANGRYTLRPDMATLSSWRASRGSPAEIDIDVIASTRNSVAPYSTTMLVDGAAGLHPKDAAAAGSGRVAAAAADGGLRLDLKLAPAPAKPAQQPPAQPAATAATAAAAPEIPCFTFKQDYGPRLVNVGQLSGTAKDGFRATFGYTSSASSSLGIGYSYSGAFGSFSQKGTKTSTSTATVTFPALTAAGSRVYQTKFTYGRYYGTGCSPSSVFYHTVRSTGFAGGASSVSTGTPAASYCTRYAAGSSFTKTSTTATSRSTGVDTSGAIGIDMESQTGYSSEAKISVSFSSARNLCGASGYPGNSPGRIVVK